MTEVAKKLQSLLEMSPESSERANRNDATLNQWRAPLFQHYRHFNREGKVKLAKAGSDMAKEEPETWPAYEAYLFTDLILFISCDQIMIPEKKIKAYDCGAMHIVFCGAKNTKNPKMFELLSSIGSASYLCFCPIESEVEEWISQIEETRDEELNKLQKTSM